MTTQIGIERAVTGEKIWLLWAVGTGLLFPLFFQISGGIYKSIDPVWDSGGVITQLPLPISVIACYGGLLLLGARYRQAALALQVVTAMALTMFISLLAGLKFELRKVILLIQVLLPAAGLVLGQMVEDENKIIPRAFLGVLLVIVPLQLLAGLVRGNLWLTHYLYLFSIYQHFQYVPLIFVCGFVYSMSALWDSYKKPFYFLTPLMCIYSLQSLSFLTFIAFSAFVFTFMLLRLQGFKKILTVIFFAAAISCIPVYSSILKSQVIFFKGDTSQYDGKFRPMERGEAPRNVQERLQDWKLYGAGIVENTKTVFFGHPAPFPRQVKTSAHNWYLDMAYNFGVISLIPVIVLIVYTFYLLWRRKKSLPQDICWLAAIVFYLVLLDSNLKVTLRQPYPGIFAFFMWGKLLSVLEKPSLAGMSSCQSDE